MNFDSEAVKSESRRSDLEGRFRVKPRDMSALGPNSRVVAYLPGLRTILHRLRATSATPSSLYTSPHLHSLTLSLLPTLTPQEAEITGVSANPLLPLPGAMAPVSPLSQETTPTTIESSPPVLSSVSETEQGVVECLVQQCPPSLQTGFMDLFPGVSVKKGDLLVITLCEKTANDMTSWSRTVGEEREQVMQHVSQTHNHCSSVCLVSCPGCS
ncbi:Cobalamin trafficking protein CblD [Geodia barretti]|uniref:Cobalamin trafficking protein CblD n=1 Tax=Geodia barretti TaxID=519541 RepID=A0AA35X0A8_GEOBA|nr:Cobalamin trafficking protein CblD [Geodia barretti]